MIAAGDYVVELANEMIVQEVVGETVYCKTQNGIERQYPIEKLVLSRYKVQPKVEPQVLHTKKGGRPKGSKNKRKLKVNV